MGLSFENKKEEVLQHIVDWINANYKEATIEYKENQFVITGDNEDAKYMRKEIKRLLNFSKKQVKQKT